MVQAIAGVAAVALAVAVIGSHWQLIAFAAPLLGVLCSVGWQPPVPVVRLRASPVAQRCFESERAPLTVQVELGGGQASLTLRVSTDPPMEVEVDEDSDRSGRRTTVSVSAARWGRYPVRVTVDVAARGGLLSATRTVEVAEVVVFPMAPSQPTPVPRSELLDRVGTHLTRHTGRGVEYADIRAYVPGDALRAVNWPVSARRGSLHVTQRLTDRAADVVVLLDAYPQARGPATLAAERAVHGAAQVVQTALRNGDRAGVVALGGRRPRWLGPGIGQRQFYRILDTVLAAGDVFETTDGTLAPRTAVPAGALIVAFSTLIDTAFGLALTDLRNRGHAVLVVDVLPNSPFPDDLDPLVARLWGLQRSALYRDMATLGVDVAPWADDNPLDQSLRLVTDRRRPLSAVRR